MNSSQARIDFGWQLAPANGNEKGSSERDAVLEAEIAALEPVVSAAVLVATAFRLRDEASLIDTLRLLTEAVRDLETRRAAEDS
ncbi:hypothetical protein [Benzoatithermus flavus]|uniref:Uncharacterized protein n=1 Tax=Benzoatithermus flavus TaxID=3108223 RepID=A0ABU8XSW0_9PROT